MPTGDKYKGLTMYLRESQVPIVALTFSTIESLLGFPLPASARNGEHSWWGNDRSHSQAAAWMSAGYRVAFKDVEKGLVRFERR